MFKAEQIFKKIVFQSVICLATFLNTFLTLNPTCHDLDENPTVYNTAVGPFRAVFPMTHYVVGLYVLCKPKMEVVSGFWKDFIKTFLKT